MADALVQGEEWLDYSSSFDGQERLFKPVGTEVLRENIEEDCESAKNASCELENVRGLLKRTLHICDATHVHQNSTSRQDTSTSSPMNEYYKHWIWIELISNLNAVRQPKWYGSSLEKCYCHSLQISKDLDQRQQLQIAMDSSCQDLFNFHSLLSTSKEYGGDRSRTDNELVNVSETDNVGLFDLTNIPKDTRLLDDSFEDLDAELEWSDNDVNDDASLSNTSLSSSGMNESEATAELVVLPYAEILRLRDDLKEYTKQYSDVLVVELENRDAYIREKELKNDFISSFLSVQEKLRETKTNSNKKKFSLQSNTTPNSQSLTTIPYEITNGGPSIDILPKLIEIMDAIRTNNPNVPSLLTDYILKVLCK